MKTEDRLQWMGRFGLKIKVAKASSEDCTILVEVTKKASVKTLSVPLFKKAHFHHSQRELSRERASTSL